MHEPIVSKELFDKVQNIFEERSKVMAKKHAKTKEIRESMPNLFKNRIYCGDCGKRMRFVRHKDKKTDDQYVCLYYICGGFRDSHYEKCSRHHIGYNAVCDAVYSAIRTQLELALEEEKLLKRLRGTKNERDLIDLYNGQINHLSQEFQKINTKRENLYENYTEGLLDVDEYQFAKQSYDAKAEEIQIQLKAARDKKNQLERVLSDGGEWLAALRKVEQELAVSQDMVNDLVNRICIYEDGRVEVFLNYADEKKAYEQIVNELSKCEQYEFFDDGFSGTNFDRPSFERLIEKIKSGAINCIVVKDFSRFGRNYIELGDYLERIFPFLGVRFISVNDHYDSNDYKGTTGGLDVVMKNIVYDYYSKDLSVKVSTAKRSKAKQGLYLGGHVPYGLKKHDKIKGRLVIDEEAAAVVREIFDYALEGHGTAEIATKLNNEHILTPGQYYCKKHPEHKKFKNHSSELGWNNTMILNILKQEMYYGAVVGHKREYVMPCSKVSRSVPKSEQIIIEGKHEAIVSKEE